MSFVRYAVTVDAPKHIAEIELRFPTDGDRAVIALPAWSPGSYLIRDYARYVRDLVAFGSDGPRRVTKQDKTTWVIDTTGSPAGSELTVRYGVYGHGRSVRTNQIDARHAFLRM